MRPNERLARLEAQMEQLLVTAARAHADLKEHIDWQRRTFESTQSRLSGLDQNAEQVHTHLRWMKAAWMAVQGTVIGWIGLK